MQRATPTSTHSPSDSLPSRPGLPRRVVVGPGLDEEGEVDLRHVCGDEQGSRPDALSGTAGAREGGGELNKPVRITQSNSHEQGIGSPDAEDHYRSG